MGFHEENEIFLSQLISAMLLFKREIPNNELISAMTLFDKLGYDVIDEDSVYDGVYKYTEDYIEGYRLLSHYNYDSIILKNKKRMFLDDFLLSNTTQEIINVLSENIYFGLKITEKGTEYIDYDIFNKINSFIKTKKVLSKKKNTKLKHEAF